MSNRFFKQKKAGFTLIEILVVIGIIAILAAIVIIAINPARQFAQARNSQRTSNVNAILNGIGQNIADNKGLFSCAYTLTTTETEISKAAANIRPCLVATYMPELTVDPTIGTNTCDETSAPYDCAGKSYASGYTVSQNSTGRVKVCAPQSALETAVVVPKICVER